MPSQLLHTPDAHTDADVAPQTSEPPSVASSNAALLDAIGGGGDDPALAERWTGDNFSAFLMGERYLGQRELAHKRRAQHSHEADRTDQIRQTLDRMVARYGVLNESGGPTDLEEQERLGVQIPRLCDALREGSGDLAWSSVDHYAQLTEQEDGVHYADWSQPEQGRARGELFVTAQGEQSAVAPGDVNQGRLGDCWLMAAMASLAAADGVFVQEHLIEAVEGSEGRLWRVNLYQRSTDLSAEDGAFVRKPVVVDMDLPTGLDPDSGRQDLAYGGGQTHRSGPGGLHKVSEDEPAPAGAELVRELWPAILEKAFAQAVNTEHRDGYGGLESASAGFALSMMTGNESQHVSGPAGRAGAGPSEDEVASRWTAVTRRLDAGVPVSASLPGHAVALIDYEAPEGEARWGKIHIHNSVGDGDVEIEDWDRFYAGVDGLTVSSEAPRP